MAASADDGCDINDDDGAASESDDDAESTCMSCSKSLRVSSIKESLKSLDRI